MTLRPEALWIGLSALTLVLFIWAEPLAWLVRVPDAALVPMTQILNAGMGGFTDLFGPLFRLVGGALEWPIWAAQRLLQALPWAVTAAAFALLALLASGPRLAVFVGLALFYMALIGFWTESMNSLALVLISVPLGALVGLGFGVWAFYSARARRGIVPLLDLAQAIPAFAYLLPILILFGFGTTVGLVASVIFAFPPMVRNTLLGLRGVNLALIEAGLMSGATDRQLFWKVRLPAAKAQLLLGLNQTTMAALSMVIIAAIIGGTADIGWEVLSKMRKAAFGESLLAGLVIALLAMVLDRISYGFATRDTFAPRPYQTRRAALMGVGILGALGLMALIVPALQSWPEAWVVYPAQPMNEALRVLVVDGRETIEAVKNTAFFFLMLPVKIGLQTAVSPFTWGFALTPTLIAAYAALVALGAGALWARGRATLAALTVLGGVLGFIGLTEMPWFALCALIVALAWRTGGRLLAAWTAAGLAFLLLTGIWPQAVLSLYLCGLAVLIAFGLGSLIGIAAAEYGAVSRLVRPIMDTLQTMPLFVILIPFVMIFKIGEFTALLAIVAYAIVPAIRYTEHGLRTLPGSVIEAASCLGATRWQLLTKVKIPLGLPAMMLGLNQTIVYAISMLVIAALVGTNGLGQRIYIGLGDGDFGVGITAGLGMALIAMIADRVTQAISRRWQAELGLPSA